MVKRKENEDELRAREWLRRQGYRDIQRQCNDPPDFVVNGDYAVEVTRLNQRIIVGNDGRTVGEEERRKPLTDQIAKTIEQLGPPGNEGRSWIIDCEYDFSVPLPSRETVSAQMSDALAPLLKPYDKHVGETSHLGFPHLHLDCGISLELTEVADDPARFILQNVSDGKGILVAGQLGKGIQNCVRKKSEKVRRENKVDDFESWWLILVDHVYHLPIQTLSEHELSLVRDQQYDFWSRVVVVSSREQGWHYDLISR